MSWNRAGNRAWPSLRLICTVPDSSGVRSASITCGANSGASSRNSTPRWASEMAPGRASRGPPPTMLTTEAEWCGSL